MTAPPGEVSALFVEGLLAFAERALGPDARAEVLARAGLDEQPAVTDWVSVATTLAVARATSAVTGERDVAWHAGAELVRQSAESGLGAFLRRSGDVADAIAALVEYGSRLSNSRVERRLERGDGRVVVESRAPGPVETDFFCRVQAGCFAALPGLFSGHGTTVEPSCQARGDERCRFVVTWAAVAPDADAEQAAVRRSDAILRQFEALEDMAAELASARDADTALERVLAHVGTAVTAPRFLLVARVAPGAPVRVHARGFHAHEVADAQGAVESRAPRTPWGTPVVVEARGTPSVAWLAAFVPEPSAPSAADERLLRAYARHATSVLDTAHALESARDDRDTARVLLELAHALARSQTRDGASHAITAATRTLTHADYANVWLWDDERHRLRLGASEPALPADLPDSFDVVDAPALLTLRARPRPILLAADDARPVNAGTMARLRTDLAAYAPIVARGDLLGLVAVGFVGSTAPLPEADLLARLGGVADLASEALDNVRLLERVQHEASHDALTGLPNRSALAGPATGEPADSATGLVFVDIDGFKHVNDRYGHRVGDELLTVIAARMAACMRPTDTLARFAGDEFVVAVRDCSGRKELDEVAARLRAALDDPLVVDDEVIAVSASIGVAHSPTDGADFEALLNAADLAMYEEKRSKDASWPRRTTSERDRRAS